MQLTHFHIVFLSLFSIKDIYSTSNNLINPSENTIENCFDITLNNEDFTIGKIIEYYLHKKYFTDEKKLNYVGFLKKHPHNKDSFIKVSFKDIITKDEIIIIIENCINDSILLINTVKDYFSDK